LRGYYAFPRDYLLHQYQIGEIPRKFQKGAASGQMAAIALYRLKREHLKENWHRRERIAG
jgi:hypothetical protein